MPSRRRRGSPGRPGPAPTPGPPPRGGGAAALVGAADRTPPVALPEVPLLAVLPGAGGLTRLVDKRHVRRDRADFFCTLEEGVKGKRALDWGLVDELVS